MHLGPQLSWTLWHAEAAPAEPAPRHTYTHTQATATTRPLTRGRVARGGRVHKDRPGLGSRAHVAACADEPAPAHRHDADAVRRVRRLDHLPAAGVDRDVVDVLLRPVEEQVSRLHRVERHGRPWRNCGSASRGIVIPWARYTAQTRPEQS